MQMASPQKSDIEFFEDPGHNMVHTTSHLRMWLLTSRKEYEVISINIIPKTSLLGYDHYKKVWLLQPENNKPPESSAPSPKRRMNVVTKID